MSTGSSTIVEDSPLVHLQKEIISIKESLQEIIFNNRNLKNRINVLTRETNGHSMILKHIRVVYMKSIHFFKCLF